MLSLKTFGKSAIPTHADLTGGKESQRAFGGTSTL